MSILQDKAVAYFKTNVHVNEIFGTSDGFLFLQKADAKTHAKTLKSQGVETFKNTQNEATAEKEAKKGFLEYPASDVIEGVKSIEDIAMLQAYEEQEANAQKPRKTVLEALKARIDELTKKIEVKK